MSISQRLAAHRLALSSAAPAKDKPLPGHCETDETEDETETESNPEEDQDMTEDEMNAAKAAARKEGFDAATARFSAVLGSQHFAGRETLAKTLLATDLSAEQIDAALAAAAPAAAIAPAKEEDDAAARAEMAAAIAENKNSGIQADDAAKPEQAEAKAIADGFAKGAEFANQMNGHNG